MKQTVKPERVEKDSRLATYYTYCRLYSDLGALFLKNELLPVKPKIGIRPVESVTV